MIFNQCLEFQSGELESAFHKHTSAIKRHPLLRQELNTDLTGGEWMTYVDARTKGASSFVHFLHEVEHKNHQAGHYDIAKAAYENRLEELGIVRGQYRSGQSHQEWREQFRTTMLETLEEPSYCYCSHIDVAIMQYNSQLNTIIESSTPLELAGTFAALELLIKHEYRAILKKYLPH